MSFLDHDHLNTYLHSVARVYSKMKKATYNTVNPLNSITDLKIKWIEEVSNLQMEGASQVKVKLKAKEIAEKLK